VSEFSDSVATIPMPEQGQINAQQIAGVCFLQSGNVCLLNIAMNLKDEQLTIHSLDRMHSWHSFLHYYLGTMFQSLNNEQYQIMDQFKILSFTL
jgi:hypothetical protein